MKEEHLLTGLLEPTNEPYAIAKIAGIKMCESYNRQYGTKFVAVMPTNFTYRDLDPTFPRGEDTEFPRVVVWGSGTPRRELLYVDDMAHWNR